MGETNDASIIKIATDSDDEYVNIRAAHQNAATQTDRLQNVRPLFAEASTQTTVAINALQQSFALRLSQLRNTYFSANPTPPNSPVDLEVGNTANNRLSK